MHQRIVANALQIPHLYAPVKDGGWSMLEKLYENQARELSGTPLLFAMLGLTFFSIPCIRRRFYEAFKYMHIFLALVYIACFFWHAYGNLCVSTSLNLSCPCSLSSRSMETWVPSGWRSLFGLYYQMHP